MNAYQMKTDLRGFLGEATATHWTDLMILNALNRSQKKLYKKMSMAGNDWFTKRSAALTPSSSQVSLPTDCAKPVYMEEVVSKQKIYFNQSVMNRRLLRQTEALVSEVYGFLLEDVIEINQDNFTKQVYLWYERTCPGLHFGTAAAGGSTSLTLEASANASRVDDHYNGLIIEVESGTGAGTRTTIDDYDGSTLVCTTAAGTFGSDSVYGMVPIIPEAGYEALFFDAFNQLLVKPAGVIRPETIQWATREARETMRVFEDWISSRSKASRYNQITENSWNG